MSAYAAECARRCPTGCGEGLELLSDNLTGHRSHWLEGANEDIPCTAPTIEAWAEELAAKLAQVTAERDAALQAVGKLASVVEEVRIATVDEFSCNHPADDGSDDCGDIEDCRKHWIEQQCAVLAEPTVAEQVRKAREIDGSL